MKDQVDSLKANGISACYTNSSQSAEEQQFNIDNLKSNIFKLVYIAPESLSYLDVMFNEFRNKSYCYWWSTLYFILGAWLLTGLY